jgi:NAD(P)H-flavin reductase
MANNILSKQYLNEDKSLFELEVNELLISQHAQGGNFVILRIDETGERFPLTIADYDRRVGTITMVVAAVGKSTNQLSTFEIGDRIQDIVGPLGKSIPIIEYDKPIVFIGGGVGIAPLFPQVKEMKAAGNTVISILGARTKDLLFWEDKFQEVSDEVIITTDDGSYGKKGLVTDRLNEVVADREIARVTAIGPLMMMKYVALATQGAKPIPTTVSLNTLMVDGTGMCGSCRFQTLSGETKFACVDGPDVDGHDVDFDNLIQRNRRFLSEEQKRLKEYQEECQALQMLVRQ